MDKKTEITETLLKLGFEKGFDNVSLQEIADYVGIKKASVFSHFKNYEEIKQKAVEHAFSILENKTFNLNTKTATLEDLLVSVVNGFIDIFSDFPANALLSFIHQKELYSNEFSKLSEQINMMISSRLTVALDFAVQRSWIDIPDTDAISKLFTPLIKSVLETEYDDEEISDLIHNITLLLQGRK